MRFLPALCFGLGLLATASAAEAAAAPGEDNVRALLEARSHAVLSSEIAGRIERLPLEPGQGFAQGDLLVGFDCNRYQAELDAARAGLKGAEVTVRQSHRLEQLQSIGASEVELAGVKAEAARAAVHKAETDVHACEIRAPFEGRVVEEKVKPHESVPAGSPLLEILSDRDLKVTLMVPSSWTVWLTSGKRFDLKIDETGESLTGEVTFLGAKVDPVSQSLKVTGKLILDKARPAPHLIAGMSGTAHFETRGETTGAR